MPLESQLCLVIGTIPQESEFETEARLPSNATLSNSISGMQSDRERERKEDEKKKFYLCLLSTYARKN